MKQPFFFGIRHLSPAGAYHLRRFLEEKKPRLVLIEGPGDFQDQMQYMVHPDTKPPFAVLAYTVKAPVRTILYPFAEYSPEYQAVSWCMEQGVSCRFMDLPSDVFLALSTVDWEKVNSACGKAAPEKESGQEKQSEQPGAAFSEQGEEGRLKVYEQLDRQAGEDGHETFWERVMEHTGDTESYHQGAALFGAGLRELTEGKDYDWAETTVREAYMSRTIARAVTEGFAPEEIVVVTGAYHVEGIRGCLKNPDLIMTDQELAALPGLEASHTLMPYSYYRLSTRSGYGAGNKAPAYYELLWEALNTGEPYRAAHSYLSRIAGYLRANGNPISTADVIEAVRLAESLAVLRQDAAGRAVPSLRDLRDAAVTCLGGGKLSAISLAVADTEIGTCIGALPDGVSRTSIQEDFYRQLRDLKLEKYRDLSAQDLKLDLRENRRAASDRAAFLDLYRSCFLHRLRVLGVSFAVLQGTGQDNATWAEHWVVRWTPEAEIELVEAALKGDTVALAASFQMKERIEAAPNMGEVARVIEDAFTCGMEEAVSYAVIALQAMAVEAASLEELAATTERLSVVIQYGNIRRLDPAPLLPILKQIFYRSCLILAAACVCDDNAVRGVIASMEKLNAAALAHEQLDCEVWLQVLAEVAKRDDLNTKASGFAAAILLERGLLDTEGLKQEVSRRLSRGVPADLGAGWFEGLAMKNRYALIARLSLWESLDTYLETLDDEEFKRALVFLRRAFADFTSAQKDEIAENLGEIWGLNTSQVSEALNAFLGKEEQQYVDSLSADNTSPAAEALLTDSLDDFDFDF